MIKQLIIVGRNKWDILIYYNVGKRDQREIFNTLIDYGCPKEAAKKASYIVSSKLNTGLTFSDTDKNISFVCISKTTSLSELADTIVHELKHVQSHICESYEVDESGEQAAYLIGYLARQVFRFLNKII